MTCVLYFLLSKHVTDKIVTFAPEVVINIFTISFFFQQMTKTRVVVTMKQAARVH